MITAIAHSAAHAIRCASVETTLCGSRISRIGSVAFTLHEFAFKLWDSHESVGAENVGRFAQWLGHGVEKRFALDGYYGAVCSCTEPDDPCLREDECCEEAERSLAELAQILLHYLPSE